MKAVSWLRNRVLKVALTLFLITVSFLFSNANVIKANAEALTPEATQYQVDGNPFKAEQDAGKENFQNSANKLFEQNKNPQVAPELTQKIGDAITKPAKAAKQNLEGIAGNIQDATDTVKGQPTNAYEEQKNKPKSEIKGVVETVKEKLNLDQPIYPGTKEFINDIEEKAEDTVKGSPQTLKDAVS